MEAKLPSVAGNICAVRDDDDHLDSSAPPTMHTAVLSMHHSPQLGASGTTSLVPFALHLIFGVLRVTAVSEKVRRPPAMQLVNKFRHWRNPAVVGNLGPGGLLQPNCASLGQPYLDNHLLVKKYLKLANMVHTVLAHWAGLGLLRYGSPQLWESGPGLRF